MIFDCFLPCSPDTKKRFCVPASIVLRAVRLTYNLFAATHDTSRLGLRTPTNMFATQQVTHLQARLFAVASRVTGVPSDINGVHEDGELTPC